MNVGQITMEASASIELIGHALKRVAPKDYPKFINDYTQEQWDAVKEEVIEHCRWHQHPEKYTSHALLDGKEQITRGTVKGENVVYEG